MCASAAGFFFSRATMASAHWTDIPDPTADLGWSDFKGAIHDIFAGNARKHPDRPCVVETATSTTPERRFTYRHISEATCILAHHFVQSGIQRGHVVMIFAHRGVDLVVAIMAVLAAGATFSVLDPLYATTTAQPATGKEANHVLDTPLTASASTSKSPSPAPS
jgi:non-ribosomal peptide synthetase component F